MAYVVKGHRYGKGYGVVAGPFNTRTLAEAHITDPKAERVMTTPDHPRPLFEDVLADRGIVEKKAVASFNSLRRRELSATPRAFPTARQVEQIARELNLDLVQDPAEFSSPELTARYVRQFCSANQLTHQE